VGASANPVRASYFVDALFGLKGFAHLGSIRGWRGKSWLARRLWQACQKMFRRKRRSIWSTSSGAPSMCLPNCAEAIATLPRLEDRRMQIGVQATSATLAEAHAHLR